MNKENIKKVVLAYSGGLDTSVIIPWLKENYNNCEIIAVAGDVGQGDELDGLEEKALKTGASKLIVADLTDEMVDDIITPAMKMDAKYETYLLGTAFARPVIGKKLAEIAVPVQFDRVTGAKLNGWVSKHYTQNKLLADAQVCAFTVSYCGTDMFRLASEIDKISCYVLSRGRDRVTPDDVRAVGCTTVEFDAFALANAIIAGVIRGSETSIAVGSTVIEPYDRVAIFALPESIKEIDRFFK